MKTVSDLAPDLAAGYPRSPRAMLAGYVVAARCLDKCRATLAGTNGEYHFACPLDNLFFEFTGIAADDFMDFVGSGADDEAVAEWISLNAKARDRREIIQWNNDLRYKPINEMPIELQEFLEGYIPEYLPPGAVVHVWFDVYDIEEGRMRPH
ncbi:MAG: DUF5069 domain-containing protein [Verrucomicrobiae bacterium]|nr:DUF5069 domain-containing protein [Verrucomicrobiae bacterium]